MQQTKTRLAFSPSDLVGFLACPHLTSLEAATARGEINKPFRSNPHADLIRKKGDEHEQRYLEQLRAAGREVVEISFEDRNWERAARDTEGALRWGADVVYQACLADEEGEWRGFADFVERQPDGSYEVVDTKLAHHAHPAHVLQLSYYTEQVARVSGRAPSQMHVVTGLGARESFRPGDFDAYYRRLRQRFLDAVSTPGETYPYPVEHCSLCDFLAHCRETWERDKHLSLVAGITRPQVETLLSFGVLDLEVLGETPQGARIKRMRDATYEKLRHQAELQLHRRRTGELRHDVLPLEPERGFALLPAPSQGDVWLDLEGDPWYEPGRGLEFLFGYVYLEDGEPRYEALWARDRAEERAQFERLMDFLAERRRAFPYAHIYHYAPYERTALRRLMGEHGTREREMDDLLRGEALVDIYRVVRQALRLSVESYSIKDVEDFYEFRRHARMTGGGATVAFETWLESGAEGILEGVQAYNEEDCRSLYELHRWLLRLRPEQVAWRPPPEERETNEEADERRSELERLKGQLLEGAEEGDPRWLLAQLLEYHRREEKPAWWEYFHHLGLDEEELIEDGDTIGGLEPVGEPGIDRQSLVYTLAYPAQEHKIGGEGVDPETGKSYSVEVDDERGVVLLRRGKTRAREPLPKALIPPAPILDYQQRDAVKRLAESYVAGDGRYPALAEVLERRPPRASPEHAPSLDQSYLFVQGPPGSGKTYTGARMAVELMRRGERVGVTSLSHKAIHKFLEEVAEAAREREFEFRGMKKCSDDPSTRYEDDFVKSSPRNDDMLDPQIQLVAGTAWLFSRKKMDQTVDTLFVDEGGQVSLADAIAVGTAAKSLILLGDPNQLAQVSQGSHPPGASASVLAHLLGADETLRPGMGLFLEETWRLRPEVCRFTSETFYEGRLRPSRGAYVRWMAAGNGVRFLPVEHRGHRQQSPEEAEAIAAEIERLIGTPISERGGNRMLGHGDVIVVAPYNAHVRCLRAALPDEVRVGTVDKFQGQEAAVVFYSMASSSSEDVPRGLDFLFSRNRLNVATSRAQCLSYLVASPRLLDAGCRTIEQMRMANAICRFVETADVRVQDDAA